MSEPRDDDALTEALRDLGAKRPTWRSQPGDALALGKVLRRRRHRRLQAASGALSLAVVAGLGTAVLAAPEKSSVVQVEPADAAPPDDGGEPASATSDCVVPEGDRSKRQWLAKGGGTPVIRAITDLLDKEFRPEAKEDPMRSLRNGLIGLALDYVNHEVVVVVDPKVVDMTELDRAVQAATARALAGRSNIDVTARVHAGCHSSSDLVEAHDTLMRMRADYGNPTMAGSRDPYAAVWEFSVSSQDYTDAVKAELGDLVQLTCCPDASRGAG